MDILELEKIYVYQDEEPYYNMLYVYQFDNSQLVKVGMSRKVLSDLAKLPNGKLHFVHEVEHTDVLEKALEFVYEMYGYEDDLFKRSVSDMVEFAKTIVDLDDKTSKCRYHLRQRKRLDGNTD